MAKKTIAELQVKTSGAQKAAKDLDRVGKSTESVGRSQTRLGQASASAGRSFSAQASGLGGLVGVYAAAAANVFAITAAFEALGRAAQAEQIVRGTKTLALEIGAAGQTVLNTVQNITQGQLTIEEAAQNINIALSAGFNADQIERLSEVSLKASRALGRNLTDAFQRVVRGAAKLEPELLDELGIFTRIDPAVEAYANKLGVAASSLTNFEKRQAFVNAVIEEGEKKFGSIDTTLDTTQKKFEQLRVQLIELGIEFGQLVAGALSPLVDFFNNNVGAALLLFGGILTLVFGRAVQAIGGFAAKGITDIGRFAEFIADKATFSQQKLADLRREIQQPLGGKTGGTGLSGIRTAPRVGQDPAQAQRFAEALELQRSGAVKTASELNKVNRAYKEQFAQLTPGTKSYDNLKAAIDRNNAALQTSGIRIKLLIGLSNLLNISVKGLATAFSLLGTILNSLFAGLAIAQLVGTLFDVDVLGEIKAFFTDISAAAQEAQAGFAGLVAAGGADTLAETLARLGESKDKLEEIPDIIQEINETLEEFQKFGTLALRNAAVNQGFIDSTLSIRDQKKAFDDLSDTTKEFLAIQVALAKGKGPRTGSQTFDELDIELLERAKEAFEDFGGAQTFAAGAADFLGLSTERVLRLLRGNLQVDLEKGQTAFRFLGDNANLAGKRFSELTKDQQDVAASGILVLEVLDNSNKSFQRGAANSETLSKKIFGLKQAFDEIEGKGGFISQQDRDDLKTLEDSRKELKRVETIGKALVDTFGKFGQAVDKAVQQGVVSGAQLAESAEDQAKFQAEFLARQAGIIGNDEKAKAIRAALNKDAEERNSIEANLVTNAQRASKAILGLALSLPTEIEKERLARQKVVDTLKQQQALVENQLTTAQTNVFIQQTNELLKQQIDIQRSEIEIFNAKADLLKNLIRLRTQESQQAIKVLNSELDILRAQQQVADQIRNNAALRRRAERESGIRQQEARVASLEDFPALAGEKTLLEERKKLADLILQNDLALLNDRKEAAEIEATNQLRVIVKRAEIIGAEIQAINKQIEFAESQRKVEQLKIDEEKKLAELERNNQIFAVGAALEAAEQQKDVADLNIEAQKKKFEQDNAAFRLQIKALEFQQMVVNKLVEAVGGDTAFVRAIEALEGPIETPDLGKISLDFAELTNLQTEVETLQNSIVKGQKRVAQTTLTGAEQLAETQLNGINTSKRLEDEAFRARRRAIETEAAANIAGLKSQKNILIEKADALGIETDLITQVLNEKITSIELERDKAIAANQAVSEANKRAQDRLKSAADAISKTVQDNLVNGFVELNDALIEGTLTLDNFKDGLRGFVTNLIKEIQRIFFTKTVAEPAAGFLSKLVMSGFSVGGGGTDADLIGISGPLPGEGNMSAAGGIVKMAAGGMLRDRVPALLEPGEFVIRKASAKAAGGPALNALNATGKMPGAVSINIQNEGQPKDAEQSEQPRFDGEKFVVDVVLRDLSNNGPIRKSLRAGG